MKKYNVKFKIENKELQEGVLSLGAKEITITIGDEKTTIGFNEITSCLIKKAETICLKYNENIVLIYTDQDNEIVEEINKYIGNTEDKPKLDKSEGTPVRYHTFWDSVKSTLPLSLVISVILSLLFGNIFLFLFFIIPIMALVGVSKLEIAVLLNKPTKSIGETIYFECPYCGETMYCNYTLIRVKCPNCKKEAGLYQGYAYKITDKNRELFMTQREKIALNLEKQTTKNTNKDDLEQIKQLKELLDMEAITQEEFDKKKKELLK